MKEKNNLFLMIVAVVSLIAIVGGASFAYFASSITPGEGLNLDVTAEASTAQFTATGGDFGFTVTGAEMQQGNAGSMAKAETAMLLVRLQSEQPVTCTFDIKFACDQGSAYTPTTGRGNQFEFGITDIYFPSSPNVGTDVSAGSSMIGSYESITGEAEPDVTTAINFDKLLAPTTSGGDDGYIIKNVQLRLPLSSGEDNFGYPGDASFGMEIKVAMYNLNHDQSALAGTGTKTYSGRFFVDNVVC